MTRFAAALIAAAACVLASSRMTRAAEPTDRAAWLKNARFGVMNHYLEDWIARRENMPGGLMTVEQWNDLVDHFDVEALARQIDEVGARYHIFTIGQNSGFYDSPNATYDKLVGITPSHCSRRDLIADLSAALHRRGIKLIAYLPSGAPGGDRIAREKLQYQSGGGSPNREFQRNWEAVIREWSTRWGDKVDGWWFDGCYWPNMMYRAKDPPNFESFAAAARAGNPNSIVAFNPGVVYRTISITPFEDYTASEVDLPQKWTPKRLTGDKVDGVRIHVLSFLGPRWGFGPEPRFKTEEVVAFTEKVVATGGAITWDVPVGRDGSIARPFLEQLSAAARAARQTKPATTRATTSPQD